MFRQMPNPVEKFVFRIFRNEYDVVEAVVSAEYEKRVDPKSRIETVGIPPVDGEKVGQKEHGDVSRQFYGVFEIREAVLSEEDGVVPVRFQVLAQSLGKVMEDAQEEMPRNDVHAVVRNLSEPLFGNEVHDFRLVSEGAKTEVELVVLFSRAGLVVVIGDDEDFHCLGFRLNQILDGASEKSRIFKGGIDFHERRGKRFERIGEHEAETLFDHSDSPLADFGFETGLSEIPFPRHDILHVGHVGIELVGFDDEELLPFEISYGVEEIRFGRKMVDDVVHVSEIEIFTEKRVEGRRERKVTESRELFPRVGYVFLVKVVSDENGVRERGGEIGEEISGTTTEVEKNGFLFMIQKFGNNPDLLKKHPSLAESGVFVGDVVVNGIFHTSAAIVHFERYRNRFFQFGQHSPPKKNLFGRLRSIRPGAF